MKNYIIIVLLLALGACRSRKETRQEYRWDGQTEVHQEQYKQQQYWSDSLGIRWLFYTDSQFTWHPDSGLRANKGLFVGQQSWKIANLQLYTSSAHDSTSATKGESQYRYKWTKYPASWLWTVGGLFIIASILVFRYLKYR